ncbi:MAG TPA: aldo/keto reductase [Burkholderiaceae bacterium]|nr:aldo/keto reductase [Burkholderiaceae bacterium]
MRSITLGAKGGASVPALGLGTWRFGESGRTRAAEVAAVRHALELGYRLIDTAEMYGDGGAEEIVGQAVAEAIAAGGVRREELFIVTKVLPQHADSKAVARAFDASRRRLRSDTIDLYLLHWRGGVPLSQTVAAFERLLASEQLRFWGVSNFDLDDMQDLGKVDGGTHCVANQVYYSASHRGIEYDLLPWQRDNGVRAMAYCPIDQGALASDRKLASLAGEHGLTAAQLALAWVLRHPDLIAIPKAGRPEHLRENLDAARVGLEPDLLAKIDLAFPPPRRKQPLAMT